MPKKIHSTKEAPAAVATYSQAVEAGGLIFVSGQIGLDPNTGAFVPGGVVEQANRALDNIEAILRAAGLDMSALVKTTLLLTTMEHFKAVNEIYLERFPSDPPARAAFAVKELPLGALVEIEAIAIR